ncbi:MAG: hypothetical protein FWE24_05770 [Defluviitaleaceae bacterium]|nr:hypothetical protein [Defluviitaleaceae bacterium]
MEQARNKVISGDYEGQDVISVSGDVSISNTVKLGRDTVNSYEIVTKGHQKVEFGLVPLGMLAEMLSDEGNRVHHLSVKFNDGKKSLLEINSAICAAIIKACAARAPGSCGISLADIKLSCDPDNRTNCRDCPCCQCTLWPKCCFGRLRSRRAKRHRRDATN